jgi:hypothetical protein
MKIGLVQRPELREALALPERFDILLVVALGSPLEAVIIDEVTDGNSRYRRDGEGCHHVPKRVLNDLIVKPNNLDSGNA